jgi:Cu/Ag efflux pump CusA
MAPTQLWELANYTIKPRLNRVNGVSTVVLQGGNVPEFQIEPDPATPVFIHTVHGDGYCLTLNKD